MFDGRVAEPRARPTHNGPLARPAYGATGSGATACGRTLQHEKFSLALSTFNGEAGLARFIKVGREVRVMANRDRSRGRPTQARCPFVVAAPWGHCVELSHVRRTRCSSWVGKWRSIHRGRGGQTRRWLTDAEGAGDAVEQGDEADEAFGGTNPRAASGARPEAPPHARAVSFGRGHRFAAYPRCSADLRAG